MTITITLNGQPVAGAFVTLHVNSFYGIGGENASGTTDSNGHWNPPNPPDMFAVAQIAVTYTSGGINYGGLGSLSAGFGLLNATWDSVTIGLLSSGYSIAVADQNVEIQQSKTQGNLTTEIIIIAVAAMGIIAVSNKV